MIVDGVEQTCFTHTPVLLVPLAGRVIRLVVALPSESRKGLEASSANLDSAHERATYSPGQTYVCPVVLLCLLLLLFCICMMCVGGRLTCATA